MCDCIIKVNEHLAPSNAELGVGLALIGNTLVARLLLRVEKKDPNKRAKGPLPAVSCNFCPFCGEKASAGDDAPSPHPQEGKTNG